MKLKFLQGEVRRFVTCESGEVTIAWVVITAAVVSLSVVVLTSIGSGTEVLADNIDADLSTRDIIATF